MKRTDFNRLREETIQTIFGINNSKGADYAGDDDALGNFKDAARAIGITPEQVWAVYTHKHISAVMSYCEKGQVESEPIEGRIHDIMVYCLLLLGLIEDQRTALQGAADEGSGTAGGLPRPFTDTDPRRGER